MSTSATKVKKIGLAHLPSELPLYIACFTSVNNAAHIKTQLTSSNSSYNYTFLDARLILSTTHLLTACFRGLTDYLHRNLKSNNVHSEILFSLSPNNNIGEAFRRFGIDDESKEVVIVKVGEGRSGEQEEFGEWLRGAIEGDATEFGDEWFATVCDLDRTRKIYKIPKLQQVKGAKMNGEPGQNDKKVEEIKDLERQVLGLMALRGAT